MLTVNAKSFSGQKMDRHSVPGKCVQYQHVKKARCVTAQGQSAVAFYDRNSRPALAQIREERFGDVDYLVVELIETKHVTRPAVSGERAHPQADHAHALWMVEAFTKKYPGSRFRPVIGDGTEARGR